jgi:hypothetical protein
MPVIPNATSRTPAIRVHMNKPSTPWLATMPATMTTKAPVGPPICVRDPPKAEMSPPATTVAPLIIVIYINNSILKY